MSIRRNAVRAAVLLCGCGLAFDTGGQAPAMPSADEGTAIGSILLLAPAGVTDDRDRKIVTSLESKSYEAVIGRFVIHDLGIAGWTQHPGERYRFDLTVGVARDFVIHAPAGSYSFQKISQRLKGPFGQYDGCRIDGIANFEIEAGKTRYVGQLVIASEFRQDRRFIAGMTNLGRIPRSLPEAVLSMHGSVDDRKAERLAAVRPDEAIDADAVDTELMFVDNRNKWDCVPESQPAKPPM